MYLLQPAQFFGHLFCALFALFIHRSPSPPYELAPPGPLYALLSVCRSEPGLSLVGCGYAQVGKSVQTVRGKAGAWVALEVSVPQQFLDQAIAFAPARVHAYADCRSTHHHVRGWLP